MNYQSNFPNPNDLFRTSLKPSNMFPENYNPPKYEDTYLKDLADDIKESQEEINKKLDLLISENAKSSDKAEKINKVILLVAILTFIATVIGILVQFL